MPPSTGPRSAKTVLESSLNAAPLGSGWGTGRTPWYESVHAFREKADAPPGATRSRGVGRRVLAVRRRRARAKHLGRPRTPPLRLRRRLLRGERLRKRPQGLPK